MILTDESYGKTTLIDATAGQIAPPRTFTQWIGAILRATGERLDPVTVHVPSVSEVKASKLQEVEYTLLGAEAEEERARHTVAMLRERRTRLQSHDTYHSPAQTVEVARR